MTSQEEDHSGEIREQMHMVHLKWTEPSNDPEFRGGQFLGQECQLTIVIAVHPNTSGRIIVNYPGAGGDIDGYNNKYKTLATHMQARGLGAVVRTEGPSTAGYTVDTHLRKMIQHAQQNAQAISGSDTPELLLMGFSAGASAIAAAAHDYPAVSRILLMAPSGDAGQQAIEEGLAKFGGEVYIVIGKNDEVVGVNAGKIFHDAATGASHKELITIPNCDHQFRGGANGRIMSQAPFYAFVQGEKPSFPDPTGGITLY